MTIQHNIITDPDIHEPKGVATAASGKVYKANGDGTSGTWEYPILGQDSALSGQVFSSDGSGSGDWVYPPSKGHAEIYINAGTTAHTLSSASQFTKLNPGTEWTPSGAEEVLDVDEANGEIILTQAGHYKIDFWINFVTASLASSTEYYFKFALDGVVSPRILTRSKPTNGADSLNVSAMGIFAATAGQKLSIHAAGDSTSSSTVITPTEAGLIALHLD